MTTGGLRVNLIVGNLQRTYCLDYIMLSHRAKQRTNNCRCILIGESLLVIVGSRMYAEFRMKVA